MHEDAQQAKKGASTLARLRSLALGLPDQFPGGLNTSEAIVGCRQPDASASNPGIRVG